MVTLLDVSAVAGHHAMPAALLLNKKYQCILFYVCHLTPATKSEITLYITGDTVTTDDRDLSAETLSR